MILTFHNNNNNNNWQLRDHQIAFEMKEMQVRAKLNRLRARSHTRMHLHYSKSFQLPRHRVIKGTIQCATIHCSRYVPLYQYFHAVIIALYMLLRRIRAFTTRFKFRVVWESHELVKLILHNQQYTECGEDFFYWKGDNQNS